MTGTSQHVKQSKRLMSPVLARSLRGFLGIGARYARGKTRPVGEIVLTAAWQSSQALWLFLANNFGEVIRMGMTFSFKRRGLSYWFWKHRCSSMGLRATFSKCSLKHLTSESLKHLTSESLCDVVTKDFRKQKQIVKSTARFDFVRHVLISVWWLFGECDG